MRGLGKEDHRHSRRRCSSCGRSYVAVSFGGLKLVPGSLCVDCEVEERIQNMRDKLGEHRGK